jgi:hypothetical protein
MEAVPNPGLLTLLIGGQSVGAVAVDKRYPRAVFGRFWPCSGLDPYRPMFEAAVELSRQFDATTVAGPCDYLLWNRLMAAYAEIKRLGPVFAELPVPIDEFAVMADWSVEITFAVAAT